MSQSCALRCLRRKLRRGAAGNRRAPRAQPVRVRLGEPGFLRGRTENPLCFSSSSQNLGHRRDTDGAVRLGSWLPHCFRENNICTRKSQTPGNPFALDKLARIILRKTKTKEKRCVFPADVTKRCQCFGEPGVWWAGLRVCEFSCRITDHIAAHRAGTSRLIATTVTITRINK